MLLLMIPVGKVTVEEAVAVVGSVEQLSEDGKAVMLSVVVVEVVADVIEEKEWSYRRRLAGWRVGADH